MVYIVQNYLFISLLVGSIYLITILITSFFPPKEINHLYGYRTKNSMLNQETWDYAQKKSGIEGIKVSIAMIIISAFPNFISLTETQNMIMGLIVCATGTAVLMYRTEKAIKRKFNLK